MDVTLLNDVDASGGLISTTRDVNRFLRALMGGELLPPDQLAEMQRTVPVSDEVQPVWPGARYGLGLFQHPLPCGGTYWAPGGTQVGWVTRTAVTADGRDSVVVSLSTHLADSMDSAIRQERAVGTLVANALCGDGPEDEGPSGDGPEARSGGQGAPPDHLAGAGGSAQSGRGVAVPAVASRTIPVVTRATPASLGTVGGSPKRPTLTTVTTAGVAP